ncbi:conserved hypothetical protein [Histoplasma capsulatum G186AR]|uniref:Cytochrome P450 n=2 Tax=Ajellomyces capsulatus TaxID=5037 RepID=C0NYC1_AJECG|nr:uncharacterized protein HCBG_07915 [Histoplasma capsulatum G186AR]EEH03789.1 conserved hypothetical protein [Histoplasma capsulatum G186AR]KAG5293638.1 cytochrome P450 [Histoplasma capsulatum]QSS75090.1 cytochrome P450 [Histoplasma capsulatum G186AR]
MTKTSMLVRSLDRESAAEFVSESYFKIIFATAILVCIVTRAYSGIRSHFRSTNAGEARRPGILPYWLPYFGHALSFGFRRRNLLEHARDNTPEPVFSLYICGRRHNIVASPSLAKALLAEQKSSISPDAFINYVMERVFGAQENTRNLTREDFDAQCRLMEFQMREPFASDCSSIALRQIEQNIPNMLSFCSSIVDQSLWERMSAVSLVSDGSGQACEVNLYTLVRNFAAVTVMSAIMGEDFMEALPNTPDDIRTFNNNFNAIVLGIQRWVPFPGLPTSYRSRRRLLQGMEAFHSAFEVAENGHDPGFDWRQIDEASEFIQSHCRTWKNAGLAATSMASESLALLWAMDTKLNTIICWNLIHILADGPTHSQVMKEIAPYSRAGRPDSGEAGFQLPEPPRLSLDADRLVDSCPLLKATYYETLRLHSCPVTYQKITEDFKLTESAADAKIANRKQQTYEFRKGEYIAIPHALHNTDSHYFGDPEEFDPERFLMEKDVDSNKPSGKGATSEKRESSVSQPELKIPEIWTVESGGGDTVSQDGKFAERVTLGFVAGLLAMWDIQPVKGMGWKIPKQSTGGLVYEPKTDIRVRIKSKV